MMIGHKERTQVNLMIHLTLFSNRTWRCTIRPLTAVFGSSFLAIALLALALGVLLALTAKSPYLAQAQGGANGVITRTTVADFENACTVLAGTIPNPTLSNISISPANGGEIRLRATLEDYFDDTVISNSLWLQTDSQPLGPSGNASEGGGVVTLEAMALRSQASFNQANRFFEARALIVTDPFTQSSTPDLGYYRINPPLYYTETIIENTALRVFVFPPDDVPYVLARDGGSASTLFEDTIATPVLTQPHLFRIEWGSSETDYYVDGSLQTTLSGNSSLPSYVFLYSQDPSDTGDGRSPLEVDWVRAGQYSTNGVYTSCVQDGGGIVNWTTLASVLNNPAGTSTSFESRTSVDGSVWSSWTAVSGGNVSNPSGRYFQYRANLSTTNVTQSPEVQQVSVSYFGPNSVVVTPSLVALNPGGVQSYTAQAYDQNNRSVSNLNYSWQLVNGGGTLNSSGLFTAGNVSAGNYANTVRGSTTGAATVSGFATVTVNNVAPVAEAGGPYFGAANQAISVNGLGSSDPNNDSLSYGWDLDNDGQYDDAFTATANYSWGAVGTYTVRLLVTDTLGLTGTDTAQAVVNTSYIYLPIIIR